MSENGLQQALATLRDAAREGRIDYDSLREIGREFIVFSNRQKSMSATSIDLAAAGYNTDPAEVDASEMQIVVSLDAPEMSWLVESMMAHPPIVGPHDSGRSVTKKLHAAVNRRRDDIKKFLAKNMEA